MINCNFQNWTAPRISAIWYSDHNADDTALLVSTKADFTHFVASLNSSRSSILEEKFTHFVDDLHEIYSRNPFQWSRDITGSIHNNPLSNVTWNLFFAATTLTSIGYGTDAPDSLVGRIFCLVYLFFGIPLYLITLADLAKFCTELMNKIYIDIIKCKHRLKRKYRRWKSGRARRDSVKVGHLIIAGGEDEVAEFLWTHLEHAQFVEIPFLLIIGVLLVYIAFASYMISLIEGWQLSDGFYFMMISVLTIGFGDLVPRNEMFILIVLLLILVGLVLTTTCIDVVGAYYIDKLHFFGRRLDDDPLSWLKEVQQRRIEAMKREAMRKLFETVTALHHIRFTALKHLAQNVPEMLPDSPGSPRNLVASHATADSVLLRWCAPLYVDEGKRYWYTLTYKPRTPQRRNQVVRVDFINEEKYLVTGLKSFTLYEFSLTTTTRYGSSKSAKAQEYTGKIIDIEPPQLFSSYSATPNRVHLPSSTLASQTVNECSILEPCTVPQSLRLEAISCETATVSWRPPKVNNGAESYVIQFTQEPAPQFAYWNRYKVGDSTRFTLTDLLPDTRYILCVSAEHNYGLAAMSKSIRFRTKRWNRLYLYGTYSTQIRIKKEKNVIKDHQNADDSIKSPGNTQSIFEFAR
nr:Ion transport 2 and Fibronectin domain containing protein [Haemonchus contortus]